MENNTELKQLLIVALAVVTMFGIVVGGMVYANNRNRDFEHKMATDGYEQNSVQGISGVYWVKVREESK